MLLKDIDLTWILLPLFIGVVFYSKIVRHKTGNQLRDSIKNVQTMFLMTGAIFFVMLLLMPQAAVLSSFGYPETVEEINSPEKVLKLLQDYNKVMVRTTEVVYWMLFIFIFWLFMSVQQLLQIYRNKLDVEIAKEREENESHS